MARAPVTLGRREHKGSRHDKLKGARVDKSELAKVERYLRRTFANHAIRVVPRPKKADSAEVYIGEEFIGVLFLDDEEGDRSYNFQMAILDTDLEE
jgi:hypothetical protein